MKLGRWLDQGVQRFRSKTSPRRAVGVADLCRDRARQWVHRYAAGGAAYAFVPSPVPGSTTAGLVALEATMVHAIGRIYGMEIPMRDAGAIVLGLEVAGGALRTLAREAAVFIPGFGWLLRAGIAASAIEAIGHAVIASFERQHLGRRINESRMQLEVVSRTSP